MSAPPIEDRGVLVAIPDVVTTSDGPRLRAGHCPGCAITAFPRPGQCPSCWGPLEGTPLSGVGLLYSYSVVHVAAAPYAIGYVDVPEGARVFAHLAGTDERQLACGRAVRAQFARSGDGYRVLWHLEVPGGGDGDA
jgi:uncharacterized protein